MKKMADSVNVEFIATNRGYPYGAILDSFKIGKNLGLLSLSGYSFARSAKCFNMMF